MTKALDLRGQSFGFWTVSQQPSVKNASGQTTWLCVCACGTQRFVTVNSLRTCNSTSCGCRKRKPSLALIENDLRHICQKMRGNCAGNWHLLIRAGAELFTRD